MPDLRCPNKLAGKVNEAEGYIEIACGSRHCGKVAGVTVLHRYSLESGALLDTKRFKNPGREIPQ